MNRNDSEKISGLMKQAGFSKSNINEADLILINACSVRQSAIDRIWGKMKEIEKLKKEKNVRTILTGCVLQKDRDRFEKYFNMEIKNMEEIASLFNKRIRSVSPEFESNFSASIPIMTGCNSFCSYCVVPYVRGKEESKDINEILKQVKDLVRNGYKEIWLLGQNINNYNYKGTDFADLLKKVNSIKGDFWIRFTSPHPARFSEKLTQTLAEAYKVTPYLNLPMQSGDNGILKRMNRDYTKEQYFSLVKKIRKAFKEKRSGLEKELAVSTDVIVGFPKETEKAFRNTFNLFKKVGFDMAYISSYSPRQGTAAFNMKDDVKKEEKDKRKRLLNNLLKKTAKEKNRKYLNKEVIVLVSGKKGNEYFGKTRSYKTVVFKNNSLNNLVGKFINVKITKADSFGLKGICKN